MPKRITRRKVRKHSTEIKNEESEQAFSKVEVDSVLRNHNSEKKIKQFENSMLRRVKDNAINHREMFKIMMNMSEKIDSSVGKSPEDQIGVERIDPNCLLEINIDNSFDNNIPLVQTANPFGCDNSRFLLV